MKRKYYENSVRHLKNWKPSCRRSEGKKFTQFVSRNKDKILKALRPSDLHTESKKFDLENEINDTFFFL